MRLGMTAVALLASILHIGLRIAILPAIVYSLGERHVPLAPLVLWPVALMWGSAVELDRASNFASRGRSSFDFVLGNNCGGS